MPPAGIASAVCSSDGAGGRVTPLSLTEQRLYEIGDPPEQGLGTGQALVVPSGARSGDKGDLINIGVAARSRAAYHILLDRLTQDRVAEYLAHLGPSRVERFLLPGSLSMNFVLHESLNGGGMANLRFDAQGKAVAQMPGRIIECL